MAAVWAALASPEATPTAPTGRWSDFGDLLRLWRASMDDFMRQDTGNLIFGIERGEQRCVVPTGEREGIHSFRIV
jgi:hypothetical protein